MSINLEQAQKALKEQRLSDPSFPTIVFFQLLENAGSGAFERYPTGNAVPDKIRDLFFAGAHVGVTTTDSMHYKDSQGKIVLVAESEKGPWQQIA